MLELRIANIQNTLTNSRVLDESQIDTSKVQILNCVKIKNTSSNAVMKYHIVPETEADLKAGKISVNTPIAQGLLGKKVGDKVNIQVPSGEISLEQIREIKRSGKAQKSLAVHSPAGGIVTDWQGGPAHQGGRVLATANAEIHAAALEMLRGTA